MANNSDDRTIGDHVLSPETLMLGYGYDPTLSEGSVKPPVFLTSTFVFRSAEDGRDFFDVVAGRAVARIAVVIAAMPELNASAPSPAS
jgi:methionine-gamma-lyase